MPAAQHRKQSGLMLDTAHRFYPLGMLKSYVDDVARAGGTFLHLRLSDEQNYTLESVTLGQLARQAKQNANGSYTNLATGKPFYSAAQIQELAQYAKQKGVELVPEINAPAQMNAIRNLLARKDPAQAGAVFDSNDTLHYETEAGQQFMQTLYGEAADMFADSGTHIHIGGDAFSGSVSRNAHYIAYLNRIVLHLKGKNRTVRVWNDAILPASLALLDNSVKITYHGRDGNRETPAQSDENARPASVLDLIQAGYTVLNYNRYYLSAQNDAEKLRTANWHIGIWDGQNRHNAVDASLMGGAAVAIEADETPPYAHSGEPPRPDAFPYLKAVADKVKEAGQ